jgi:lysophospholipase L1-like esterase
MSAESRGEVMRAGRAIVVWTLVVAVGALATYKARRFDSAFAVGTPRTHALGLADLLTRAHVGSTSLGAETQKALSLATHLSAPSAPREGLHIALRGSGESAPSPRVDSVFTVASIAPPSGSNLLRVAMQQKPAGKAPTAATALAALNAATGSLGGARGGLIPAYGELTPDLFANRRLTILQIGDSHTAADFFTGRVRDRLQEAYGSGGDAFVVPGKPHAGVRSALFSSDASDDWSYEALQRSDDRKRFHLSGFNALAHHASAALTVRSRNGRSYDYADVDFVAQPGGGRAEVLLDGAAAGEVNLDGESGHAVPFAARLKNGQSFHELVVKSLDDASVAVTGFKLGRDGDGVSYLSIGYPGATVQLLQKLDNGNLADDFRELRPDVVVLAFGTNEGFNDNLDVGVYIQQYEQIVRRLQSLRPGLKIVIVGPADAARPSGQCHAEGVGQRCASAGGVQNASAEASGNCRFPVPPKLNLVREAQRKLAQKIGAAFWDWSSVQPGPCGAQVWAAASPPLMAHDYVHMTLDGYKQSADRFADFLIPLIAGRSAATHVVSNN